MWYYSARLLAEDQPAFVSPSSMWLMPCVLIGFLFYFMIFRPDRQKRDQVAKLQTNLKQNDRVVTIGGIVGVVVNAPKESDEITIRIDESSKARMRILRSAISRLVSEDKEGMKSDDA